MPHVEFSQRLLLGAALALALVALLRYRSGGYYSAGRRLALTLLRPALGDVESAGLRQAVQCLHYIVVRPQVGLLQPSRHVPVNSQAPVRLRDVEQQVHFARHVGAWPVCSVVVAALR